MARDPATDTNALVAASAVVFGQMGYHNATIDDIAAAAGISRPTVYKYTKSKRHLLDLMVTHVTTYLGERASAVVSSDAPAADRLRDLLRVHIEAACANSGFYRIVLREQVELSPTTLGQFRDWEHQVTRDFSLVIDEYLESANSNADVDASVLANLVLSMTISLPNWFDPTGPVDKESLLDHIWALLSGALPDLSTVGAIGRR